MADKSMWAKLSVLIVTAFVDMVGLLMVVPIMPYYARDLGANALMVAMLVSSFTAAQLLSAPLWGRVSDRYGRRPALLIGLGAAAIAYVVFAYATSIWLLLLSRVVQGAGGGTTGVVQAYVADSVEPKERAKALGWLSAATSVGVALGPPIGSFALALFHRHGPGMIAAVLCTVNMLFAWRFLSESRDMAEAKQVVRRPGASVEAITYVLTHTTEPAPRLIWMYAIAMGAFQGMTTILALFLADKFGVGSKDIWMVFTYIGVISVITRAGVLGRAVDRYGEVALSRVGLVLLALGLGVFPFVPNYPTLAIVIALVPLGTAFTFPCVTSLLSRVIQSNERGLFMGVQQTFGGLSRVIVPLWAGYAYDHFGHGVPFWTSSALVVGVMFLGLGIDDPRKEQMVTASAA
ncbi:MAG TPA: MFS transporter [Gemmatimonadaceae bacterium]|jgi:multidrug resistance protein|nr:MFS transporter [Gemmatimonadaceae bacterium]